MNNQHQCRLSPPRGLARTGVIALVVLGMGVILLAYLFRPSLARRNYESQVPRTGVVAGSIVPCVTAHPEGRATENALEGAWR